MPITFDEITADVTPPAPTPAGTERRGEPSTRATCDGPALARELQRLAERAERLNAD